MEKEEIIYVNIESIVEPPNPTRTQVDEEGLMELANSIAEVGIIEPLIVVDRITHLEIIAGHRRYMASRIAKLKKVPVIIKNVSEDEGTNLKLHENYGREDVRPVDEAIFFTDIITKQKINVMELAQRIKKSVGYVERRLSILNLPDEILEAYKSDAISMMVAFELAKIDNENERKRAIDYSLQNGCTMRTAQGWVSQWNLYKTALDLTAKEQGEISQQSTSGPIMWTCFVCDQPENAINTFNVPLCPSCRNEMLKQKAVEKIEGQQHT